MGSKEIWNFIKIHKKELIIAIIILVGVIPGIIYSLLWVRIPTYNSDDNGWLSFWGSFLGGIFGGAGTLIAVMLTRNQTERIISQNSSLAFNQIIIPKLEEVIRICTEFIEEIMAIKVLVKRIDDIYDKNKNKSITRAELIKIKQHVEDIQISMLKANHSSNMLVSYKLYVNSDPDFDTVKYIIDQLPEVNEDIGNILKLLILTSKDGTEIDDNMYYSLKHHNIQLINVLEKINSNVVEIIMDKNKQIKSVLKNIWK